jgi:CDGSH-type Zn-finger protein/uncharacterized Fe-S cluster protein YjdI
VSSIAAPSREQLVHSLYEAAELEHNLMCTYLYAAFSLKDGPGEGLSAEEGAAVAGWRRTILDVAIEEMGHLAAVWNITTALGAAPRVGRMNFPLDPGHLPAGIVVKLAPFQAATLQHFIHLERPIGSQEPDGAGYSIERKFVRGAPHAFLTPNAVDYETVGEFYATLADGLRAFVAAHGEDGAFCGDRGLQLSPAELDLTGAKPVICLKTALAAFDAIVAQGEGAPGDTATSHFAKFAAIRAAHADLSARNPAFAPAHPAATNPVLRRPPRPEGRVWIENPDAVAVVDLANAAYGLMLRLLSYAYSVPSGPEKSLAVDIAIGLMRGVTPLGERAARLPAGPSNPDCMAGMSFTTLRDTSPLPRGPSAWRFFNERLEAFSAAASKLAQAGDVRCVQAARVFTQLAQRGKAGAGHSALAAAPVAAAAAAPAMVNPPQQIVDGVEIVEGKSLTLMFEAKRCIHARFCVTVAPKVFLANVQGPWIHPDQMDAERLADIAHACPSGAIRYTRKDGRPDEGLPPVNLIGVREAGPYSVRGEIILDGAPAGTRATLCRCGASKNKPFCDSSHHDVHFDATGEPPSNATDMLPVRDGPLRIDPQLDGPLQVRGNLEIISGTGRVVTRATAAKLCRCGGSQTKPFCDGAHAKNGFRS